VEGSQLGGPLVLFLLMMTVGLELTPGDFRRVLAAPRAVVGGTLAQWILLPLMTWGVVWLVGVNPIFGAGAVLVAVSPGAGISNILTALARANIALSVTLTAATSVFAVLTLPTIASLGMRVFLGESTPVEVPVLVLIAQLAVSLLLPISLGMWMRARRPDLAVRLAPRLQRITFIVIGLVVALGIAFAPEEQRQVEGSGRAFVAAGVWTLCAMAIGWGTASALRLSSRDRFTFLIEFSARNIAVAAIVALSGLGRLDLTFFSGVYMAVGYPLAGLAVLVRRRLLGSEALAAPEPVPAPEREGQP
jgi:BASS family bile acid:Na+ symporter